MPTIKVSVPEGAGLKKVKAKVTLKMKDQKRPLTERKKAKL